MRRRAPGPLQGSQFFLYGEGGGDACNRHLCFGGHAFPKVTAGHCDAKPVDAPADQRSHRLGRAVDAYGIVRIVTLHGVIDEREVSRRA
jgi:hypothetical protein